MIDVIGCVKILDADMAMPGEGVRLRVSLIRPVAFKEVRDLRSANETGPSGLVLCH